MEENIPLMKNAGLKIEEFSKKIVKISGSLIENKNPHNTVFGGSISVTLILAGWIKVLEIMDREHSGSNIVISSQNITYLKPVRGDFSGEAYTPDSDLLDPFFNRFNSQGKGRLTVEASLFENGSNTVCASFKGEFYIRKKTDI